MFQPLLFSSIRNDDEIFLKLQEERVKKRREKLVQRETERIAVQAKARVEHKTAQNQKQVRQGTVKCRGIYGPDKVLHREVHKKGTWCCKRRYHSEKSYNRWWYTIWTGVHFVCTTEKRQNRRERRLRPRLLSRAKWLIDRNKKIR